MLASHRPASSLPRHLAPLEALVEEAFGAPERLARDHQRAAEAALDRLDGERAQALAHQRAHGGGADAGRWRAPLQLPSRSPVEDEAGQQALLAQLSSERHGVAEVLRQARDLGAEARRLADQAYERLRGLLESMHQTLMGILRNLL